MSKKYFLSFVIAIFFASSVQAAKGQAAAGSRLQNLPNFLVMTSLLGLSLNIYGILQVSEAKTSTVCNAASKDKEMCSTITKQQVKLNRAKSFIRSGKVLILGSAFIHVLRRRH